MSCKYIHFYVLMLKLFQKQKALSLKSLQHLDFNLLRHCWDASFCRVAAKSCTNYEKESIQ